MPTPGAAGAKATCSSRCEPSVSFWLSSVLCRCSLSSPDTSCLAFILIELGRCSESVLLELKPLLVRAVSLSRTRRARPDHGRGIRVAPEGVPAATGGFAGSPDALTETKMRNRLTRSLSRFLLAVSLSFELLEALLQSWTRLGLGLSSAQPRSHHPACQVVFPLRLNLLYSILAAGLQPRIRLEGRMPQDESGAAWLQAPRLVASGLWLSSLEARGAAPSPTDHVNVGGTAGSKGLRSYLGGGGHLLTQLCVAFHQFLLFCMPGVLGPRTLDLGKKQEPSLSPQPL